jgi:hypothetical protein
VADVMAGRTIPCQKCGSDVTLPSTPTGGGAPTTARRKAEATPSVHVSPVLIISAVVGVVVLVIVLALYFGPWTVGNQWAAMKPQANTEVTDVVQFALQAYESQNGMWDTTLPHGSPGVQGDAVFVPPMMVMSMPAKIVFSGKTTQGTYMGTYDTKTGEIVATIETGGYNVGGLVDMKKATGSFKITGREKDGKMSAEVDGEPLKIVMRKAPGKDD